MAELPTIFSLPHEVLECVLLCKGISLKTMCSFAATCSKFRSVVNNNNTLWKLKFSQMWPEEFKLYESPTEIMWKEETGMRVMFRTSIRKKMKGMSQRFYDYNHLSLTDLSDFKEMMDQHAFGCYFMIADLMNYLHPGPFSNLTVRFYATKVLEHTRQYQLKKEWDRLLVRPQEQILERGAVFVAQWLQPAVDVSYSTVSTQLDDITAEVRFELLMRNKKHPLLKVSSEQLELWKTQNIPRHLWKPAEAREILEALSHVFFEDFHFLGTGNDRWDYVHINKVLLSRSGIPIMLNIIYESVARRLGVKLEPIIIPGHNLFRWYTISNDGKECYYNIDVMHQGRLITNSSCLHCLHHEVCTRGSKVTPAKFVQVFEVLATELKETNIRVHQGQETPLLNIYRGTMELLHMMNPNNMNLNVDLARFYSEQNMEVDAFFNSMTEMSQSAERNVADLADHALRLLSFRNNGNCRLRPGRMQCACFLMTCETRCLAWREKSRLQWTNWRIVKESIIRKSRTRQVLFPVGLLMRHLKYKYTCVIYGWDVRCSASQEWIVRMGVNNLRRSTNQPFYHVLVNDGTTRYVAQENLAVRRDPAWIRHWDVGRYFMSRSLSHQYTPNAETEMRYPEDGVVKKAYIDHLSDPDWNIQKST